MSTTLPPDESPVRAPDRPTRPGPSTVEASAKANPDGWRTPGERLRCLARRFSTVPVEGWIALVVVVACMGVVLWVAHPELILQNTTPTGGDMGSHVYGPKYLMDHLIPSGRLTGWTPAWFDGFPLYQFYMVLPALMMVILSVGIHNLFLGLVAVAVGLVAAASGLLRPNLFRYRWALFSLGMVIVVLSVPVPYNISFKAVTVSGLVFLPAAAWLFGKLADLPFPTPPLLAVAALFYIFNRQPSYNGTGNIVGGNFASTMAGEYSFSIALTLGVLYLGVVLRGMRTGRHRALAAALLAATGLAHLLPCFFVLLVTVIIFAVQPAKGRAKWLATMLPLGGLLSAFWILPFVLKRSFTNDMGWEKLPILPADVSQKYGTWFTHATSNGADYYGRWYYLSPPTMRWVVILALAGVVISVVQLRRSGWALAISSLVLGALFVVLPNTQLWNARLLPFLYLCVYFLAAMAVGEVAYCVAIVVADLVHRRAEPFRPVNWAVTPVLAAAGIIGVLVPLGMMPGSTHYQVNPVSSWAKGNFLGLQHKEENAALATAAASICTVTPTQHCAGGTQEYFAVVNTMGALGKDPNHGCGRAMWEYDNDRETSYGTPMSLMMLPYFTNDCIGSMEGLYFESSGTTPFHFLMQGELSNKCSCTQRDLPYGTLNMAQGVRHMQLLGVKYYMADTPNTVAQANLSNDLVPVATSGPWHIYQLKDSDLVTPLANKPMVLTNVQDAQHSWLPAAMNWYIDPRRWDVPLAIDGPKSWPRASVTKLSPKKVTGGTDPRVTDYALLPATIRNPVTPAKVTNIVSKREGISFDVDRVGSPVLVKVSYFPNWEVSGGKGPYRVSPNLMVVTPTSKHVSLSYGRTSGDWLAVLLTLGGVALAFWLVRRPAVAMPNSRWSAAVGGAGSTSGAEPPGAEPPDVESPGAGPPDAGQPAVESRAPSVPEPSPESQTW